MLSRSIALGWGIYFVILLVIFVPLLFGFEPLRTVNRILLWQNSLIEAILGPHPILGYKENGEPIYEGTPIDGIVFLFGLVWGFVIYPAVVFCVLLIRGRLNPRIS